MDPILRIPLAAIAMEALPRDRSALNQTALDELQASIAATGLRQPIEVWQLSTPQGPKTHGLISGLRRLTVHHNLHRLRPSAFGTIAAFLRSPASIADAMAAMVAENEIRADLSPWEKGRMLVQAVEQKLFPTIEAAALVLHPVITRQKRHTLRGYASVVELLEGQITNPQTLTHSQMLRLSQALRGGLVDLIQHILLDRHGQSPENQWQALLPALSEADRHDPESPATSKAPARPRRLLHLRQGLTIRRELTKNGWLLHFSGPEARKAALMEDVMDSIERNFQPDFR